MSKIGLMLPDSSGGYSPTETVEFARLAEDAAFDSVWLGEESSANSLMTLACVAMETDNVEVGTAITNVFSRSPTLIGMSAATLAEISDGRAVIGLGVSSKPIAERWHGMSFDRPLRRLRETIDIVRASFDGGQLEYDGDVFEIGPYPVGYESTEPPAIYNGAMSPTNCRLTGEFADGWLPAFVPLSALGDLIEDVETGARARGRDSDAVQYVPLVGSAVSDDPDKAESAVRTFLAEKIGMGYNRQLQRFGYGDVADIVFDRWNDGDRTGATAAITEEMLAEFAIYGTPAECREQLESYYDAGVDEVILFPPFSASDELLEETITTFSR